MSDAGSEFGDGEGGGGGGGVVASIFSAVLSVVQLAVALVVAYGLFYAAWLSWLKYVLLSFLLVIAIGFAKKRADGGVISPEESFQRLIEPERTWKRRRADRLPTSR